MLEELLIKNIVSQKNHISPVFLETNWPFCPNRSFRVKQLIYGPKFVEIVPL